MLRMTSASVLHLLDALFAHCHFDLRSSAQNREVASVRRTFRPLSRHHHLRTDIPAQLHLLDALFVHCHDAGYLIRSAHHCCICPMHFSYLATCRNPAVYSHDVVASVRRTFRTLPQPRWVCSRLAIPVASVRRTLPLLHQRWNSATDRESWVASLRCTLFALRSVAEAKTR